MIGIAAAIVVLLVILMVLQHRSDVTFTELQRLVSPDNAHVLTIRLASPSLPYGSHLVEALISRAADQEVLVNERFRLANDGSAVTLRNVESRWLDDDSVALCLRGAEQPDSRVTLRLSTALVSSSIRYC